MLKMSSIIISGRVMDLAFLAILAILVYYFIGKAEKGETRPMRSLPALQGIEEGIGRAIETNRPIFFTTGIGSLGGTRTGPTIAGLTVLNYVAKKAAELESNLIACPGTDAKVLVQMEGIVREAYQSVGKPELYQPAKTVVFLSNDQFCYGGAAAALIQRERAASCIYIGYFMAECLLMAESGSKVGAIQIGGSIMPSQVPYFAITCDYLLMGEEIYALAASISNEPLLIGTLTGEDYLKLLTMGITIIGGLIQLFGSNIVASWLGV